MAEITKVVYKRISNLGNYENEALEVEAILEDDESPEDACTKLKTFVENQLGLGPTEEELAAAEALLRRGRRL